MTSQNEDSQWTHPTTIPEKPNFHFIKHEPKINRRHRCCRIVWRISLRLLHTKLVRTHQRHNNQSRCDAVPTERTGSTRYGWHGWGWQGCANQRSRTRANLCRWCPHRGGGAAIKSRIRHAPHAAGTGGAVRKGLAATESNVEMKRCEFCQFWVVTNNKWGACHRFPPQVISIPDDARTEWPITNQDDFCGEFRIIVEPHTKRVATLFEKSK